MKRRDILRLLPAAAVIGIQPLHAATDFPKKAMRVVIPFAPAGVSDMMGRLVAESLAKLYGTTVVAENRAGASGHLGAQQVSVAPADGYTLVTGTIGIHSAFAAYRKLNYNPATDLVPITVTGEAGNLVVVPANSPYKTFQDFLEDARRNPGKIAYGSAGAGSSVHMVTALFELMSNSKLLHVPYKGSGPALIDLMSGQLQIMFDNIGSSMPHVTSGRLRVLAVTGSRREPILPNVPTIAESGVPGYSGTSWFTVAAPKGTPPALIAELAADLRKALSGPEAKARYDTMALTPVLNTPAQAQAFITAETAKWNRVIEEAKLQLD